MLNIERPRLGTSIIPTLVRSVNQIIDNLPSLQVIGDNATTFVQHTKNGTIVKALGNGGHRGGVNESTSQVAIPKQWSFIQSKYIDAEHPASGNFFKLMFMPAEYPAQERSFFNAVDLSESGVGTRQEVKSWYANDAACDDVLQPGTFYAAYLSGYYRPAIKSIVGKRKADYFDVKVAVEAMPSSVEYTEAKTYEPHDSSPEEYGRIFLPLCNFSDVEMLSYSNGNRVSDLTWFSQNEEIHPFKLLQLNRSLICMPGKMRVWTKSGLGWQLANPTIPSALVDFTSTPLSTMYPNTTKLKFYAHCAYNSTSGYWGYTDTLSAGVAFDGFYNAYIGEVEFDPEKDEITYISQQLSSDLDLTSLWMR